MKMDRIVRILSSVGVVVAFMAWKLLLSCKNLLNQLKSFTQRRKLQTASPHQGVASGKTVLVTNGRLAKALHTVRALKNVGARVIVTDYEDISASALSLACDNFILLPALGSSSIDKWVANFEQVLVENKVDIVVPVSIINEVLFIGVAQEKLRAKLAHVKWICPSLELALVFDDRAQFCSLCDKHGVPTPEHGRLVSSNAITAIAGRFPRGIMLKRIESSANRREEIIHIQPGDELPDCVRPSSHDPWQWQRYVKGAEFSVWYICIDGRVTFSACYESGSDIVLFDSASVPSDLDGPLRKLMSNLRVTGQFAFDFIREEDFGLPFVIECNPRSSSVLETVSDTPLWAEAFFGHDVIPRTVKNNIGFIFHFNSWPWTSRSEGFFTFADPLPFFAAEIVWPLQAVAQKGLVNQRFQKIDVNTCRVISSGQSAARNINKFRDELQIQKLAFVMEALQFMDTIILDVSFPHAKSIVKRFSQSNKKVVSFSYLGVNSLDIDAFKDEVFTCNTTNEVDTLIQNEAVGATRLLLGKMLSEEVGSVFDMTYNVVSPARTLQSVIEIPLRRLRVLHLMGSCTSEYYESISNYYGYECIKSIGSDGRFEHITAYVHRSGEWSVEAGKNLDYVLNSSPRLTPGHAIARLETMHIDVAIPHMFDYDGLTAYRSLFTILDIPMVGCSGEALALSNNKARTKACAEMGGVPVAKSEVLREGDEPTLVLPFVIKPTEEDNSQGVTVVDDKRELANALKQAFQFGDEVMCEEFIPPGRELRVAIVETEDGRLEMPPIIEYFVSKKSPIRRPENKLTTNTKGMPTGQPSGGRQCPADLDEELERKIYKAASTAHKVLGCQDCSTFDFRVSPAGEPYMLESCLYNSFAPKGVLVSMEMSIGIDKRQSFVRLCEKALARKRGRNCDQKFGMKRKS